MKEGIEKLNIEDKKEISEEETIQEIDRLIQEDKNFREQGESSDSTLLASVTRKELSDEDFKIFKKFFSGVWKYGEWQVYTDNVSKHIEENPKDKTNNSRDVFRDWLGKKAFIQFEKKRSDEEKQKDN